MLESKVLKVENPFKSLKDFMPPPGIELGTFSLDHCCSTNWAMEASSKLAWKICYWAKGTEVVHYNHHWNERNDLPSKQAESAQPKIGELQICKYSFSTYQVSSAMLESKVLKVENPFKQFKRFYVGA